jgi:chromosome segregation ATPase
MTQSAFSFPQIQATEIFDHLKTSLSMSDITIQDILKPTPERMLSLYARLCAICYKIPFEILFAPKDSRPEKTKGGGEHDTNLHVTSVFRATAELLDEISVRGEFHFTDISRPDYKRTRTHLSAIINYIKFVVEEHEIVYNSAGEIDLTHQSLADVEQEIEGLQKNINLLRADLEVNQP